MSANPDESKLFIRQLAYLFAARDEGASLFELIRMAQSITLNTLACKSIALVQLGQGGKNKLLANYPIGINDEATLDSFLSSHNPQLELARLSHREIFTEEAETFYLYFPLQVNDYPNSILIFEFSNLTAYDELFRSEISLLIQGLLPSYLKNRNNLSTQFAGGGGGNRSLIKAAKNWRLTCGRSH